MVKPRLPTYNVIAAPGRKTLPKMAASQSLSSPQSPVAALIAAVTVPDEFFEVMRSRISAMLLLAAMAFCFLISNCTNLYQWRLLARISKLRGRGDFVGERG